MWLYCYLDSSGNIERTNLQLYSLKKAAESWNDLARVSSCPDKSEIEDFKERLVFIVNCFGLSLSQLLGQNWPSENQERIDNPDVLLSNILNCSHIEKTEQMRLNRGFRDILRTYGAIRHFGKVKNDENYRLVEELDLAALRRFQKVTIDIWDVVVSVQRSYDINETRIENFGSIGDQVFFEEMPEQQDPGDRLTYD